VERVSWSCGASSIRAASVVLFVSSFAFVPCTELLISMPSYVDVMVRTEDDDGSAVVLGG
jgi:hypothetical protein